MNTSRKLLLCLTVALIPMLAWTPAVLGQSTTTGSLSGLVTDQEGATALPGAVINAVHQPTGTRYTALTGADGRFRMLNIRVGGPYSVAANMDGFHSQEKTDTYVKLGEDTFLTFKLQLETITEVLEVVAESSPLINPGRTGASSSVIREVVESLPSVNRSIVDIARTNPFFATWSENDEGRSIAVAGRSNRYNNIQIDGAVNNDLFGLSDSGTPGGQTESEPISLDAIEEFQLVVSPYDIRQGGFSGGGINLITKGGTNAFHGTVYYFDRDNDLIGDREDADGDEVPFGEFADTNYGFAVGGPIIKDKMFFFANLDVGERDRPTGFSIDGSSGTEVPVAQNAARFRQFLQDQYGFDPGGLDEFIGNTDSDKFFVRFDFNLSDSHQLTARHNYVDALNDIIRPSAFTYEWPSHVYIMEDETNSTVFQLNSVFGSDAFNEGRISYQTIRDNRGGPVAFPYILVEDVPNDAGTGTVDFEAGTERYSTANALDQDILELHDDFTWLKGNHTITIGTHNEFFEFDNLFIRENFGAYRFRGLEDFERGWAYAFDHSFSSDPNDPQRSARFKVRQYGLYAGDQWAVKPNLTLTYGLRVDAPFFPDKPTYNPDALQFGYDTSEFPDGNEVWSPRVGFNWDIGSDGTKQLRGGLGIFAGRTPYVWVSNQFGNTGIEFTRISLWLSGAIDENNHIPFNPDPFNQPTEIGFAYTNEIDLIDPDFEFPQVLRATLGYDHDLGFLGLIGSIEMIWSDTLKDIAYQNLNIVPTGEVRSFDGRPLFERDNSQFRDVILLTNTDEGKQFNAAFKLERPFRDGWYGMFAYTYGQSESINDGNSSQAISNWRFVPMTGDPNNLTLADSNYLIEHRFNAALSYRWEWAAGWGANVGLFWDHWAGRPYSTTYRRDENGDYEDNDLIYVPANEGEVIIQGGTWDDLNALIESDKGLRDARGSIVKRNASRAPWVHTLDLRFAQTIPIWKIRTEVTAEIENLMNLIDSDSGQVRFVLFNETSPIDLVGYENGDSINGRPIYQIQSWALDPENRWTVDDLRSRWRAKLGIRFSF